MSDNAAIPRRGPMFRDAMRVFDKYVIDPTMIDAATAAPHLTPTRQRQFARYRVRTLLAVRPAPTTPTEPAAAIGSAR